MSNNTKVAGKALAYLGGLAFLTALLGLRDILAAKTHANLGLLGAFFIVSFLLTVGGSRVTWGSWRGATLELHFHSLTSMPDDLTHSKPFLTWVLLNAIGHELLHHELIAGKRRRPKFSSEQAAADHRGEQLAALVVRRLFNPLKLDLEWERARRRLAETGAVSPSAPGRHDEDPA